MRLTPIAETVKNLPAMPETQVLSLGQEESLEKKRPPIPVFPLPEEFHGQRSKQSNMTESARTNLRRGAVQSRASPG